MLIRKKLERNFHISDNSINVIHERKC